MTAPSGLLARIPVAAAGATLIITGAALAMWLLFEVPADVVARYLAYELAFTAAPGILAWHAIMAPSKTGVKEIALG